MYPIRILPRLIDERTLFYNTSSVLVYLRRLMFIIHITQCTNKESFKLQPFSVAIHSIHILEITNILTFLLLGFCTVHYLWEVN